MFTKLEQWPTFSVFLVACIVNAMLVWVIVVFFGVTFAWGLLQRSLVWAPVLFFLAGMPIFVWTVVVQGLLCLAAKFLRPESPRTCNLWMRFGTAPVSIITLWLVTLLVGGPDFFIPRL
jgi:hypothetical protein